MKALRVSPYGLPGMVFGREAGAYERNQQSISNSSLG